MARGKTKKKSNAKINQSLAERTTSPRSAKIVLFVFGLGPLILMSFFLFSNGFFNPPG